MAELSAVARIQIPDGHLEEFKAAAARCLDGVRERDEGTLRYDWYLNADGTECIVLERYRDSDAVMSHMANIGEEMAQISAIAEVSIKALGEPSSQLMEASEGLNIEYYAPLQRL